MYICIDSSAIDKRSRRSSIANPTATCCFAAAATVDVMRLSSPWFIFGLVALVVVGPSLARAAGSLYLDRRAQRDVLNRLRDAPKTVSLSERADKAVKMYLTNLRERYSHVLDRPWDSKYTSHRNAKRWPLA